MQRMIATGLLVVGVFMLLGAGWALLASGALVWVRDDRAAAWLTARWMRVRKQAIGARTALAAVPRRSLSGASMSLGLVATPLGAAAAMGIGAGVLTAGVMLVGFSLLTGWGA